MSHAYLPLAIAHKGVSVPDIVVVPYIEAMYQPVDVKLLIHIQLAIGLGGTQFEPPSFALCIW